MKIGRALISVSDKTGVVDFARGLAGLGVALLSTGGTARALREAGLEVRDVADFTGFPEMLDGRVKTLHPGVHAGLLFRRDNAAHAAALREHGLEAIDLVCVNLYPFEATVARPDVTRAEAVEQIDIGGPSMLRSAAKNHAAVTVVTDPADYPAVLDDLRAHDGQTTLALRQALAQKAFARTAAYDAAIAAYLAGAAGEAAAPSLCIAARGGRRLRYGENPHQAAWFFEDPAADEACAARAALLHGKEMSYNNYVDADAALEAARELAGCPAAVIVKHTNPCGAATGNDLARALAEAWAGDPVSAFGSVIAVTAPVDLAAAEVLKGRFVEALLAPDFTDEALAFLRAKSKDLRLLRLDRPLAAAHPRRVVRAIHGGWLVQNLDTGAAEQWLVPTEQPFPEERRPLAEFGVRLAKHLKSNAVAVVREYAPGRFALLGMGAGQPNRVDAIRKLALPKARENLAALYAQANYGRSPRDFESDTLAQCVLVSDAFFPFPDSIDAAAEAGLRYVVQPGGSKKDETVVAACDRYGIAMAFTGVRHFRH